MLHVLLLQALHFIVDSLQLSEYSLLLELPLTVTIQHGI